MYSRILLFFLLAVFGHAEAAEMMRFQHSSGLSFSYPAAWQLREDEEGLYLIQNDGAQGNSSMPKEYFYFSMTEAPGITSASDPEVIAYFEQSIVADIPGGARAGPVDSIQTGVGIAAVIPFVGKPQGIESDIFVYVVIREEEGLYLVHVRDKAAASDRQMGKKIFASLELRLQTDPDLAGSWVRTERTSSSAGSYDPSQFSTTHLVRYVFDGAGKVAMKSDFSTSSVSDDVSTIDDAASYFHGRYSTQGEELTVEWEDGTEATWIYSVFPDYNDGHLILKLQVPGTEEAKFYDLSN